jgi:SAM-dependent methyltransferase
MDWQKQFVNQRYIEYKKDQYEIIKNYINFAPKRILDIGCGYAYESCMFQKEFGTDLYLLDGEPNKNTRYIGYNPVEKINFYVPINAIKKHLDSKNINYTFVNADNPTINQDIKFDLIISNISCGYHYPAITYKELCKKHSTDTTVTIFDIRRKFYETQLKDFAKTNIIHTDKKLHKIHLEFI